MLAILALLKNYSIEIDADMEDLYSFIIDISTGKTKFEEIAFWLERNAV